MDGSLVVDGILVGWEVRLVVGTKDSFNFNIVGLDVVS